MPDGNVGVLFSNTDSPSIVATNILKAINSQTSSVFAVSASIQGWTGTGAPPSGSITSNQINLFGAQTFATNVTGLTSIKYDNQGDVNPVRAQGEVISPTTTFRARQRTASTFSPPCAMRPMHTAIGRQSDPVQ